MKVARINKHNDISMVGIEFVVLSENYNTYRLSNRRYISKSDCTILDTGEKYEPKEWVPKVGEWAYILETNYTEDNINFPPGEVFEISEVFGMYLRVKKPSKILGEVCGISDCRKALPNEIPAPEMSNFEKAIASVADPVLIAKAGEKDKRISSMDSTNGNFPLWIHMNEQHDLLLLESELHEIIHIVNEMQNPKVEEQKEESERIPFDLKLWESGKYDVIQRNGLPAEILKSNMRGDLGTHPLAVSYEDTDGSDFCAMPYLNGMLYEEEDPTDLFLIPKTETVWLNRFESPEYESEVTAINESAYRPNGYKLIETIEVKRPIK